MKLIVLPDVHGRQFWKSAAEHIDDCDKVLFLGDYFDPYGFEDISVIDAIKNFNEILYFIKDYPDKIVMLLGNHDLPYFSEDYRALSRYHCRWSPEWHSVISEMFAADRELFKIAHVEDGVLFTHAGCVTGWIKSVFPDLSNNDSINDLVAKLNGLLHSNKGMEQLYMVSNYRGGRDDAGSCVWADVHELMGDYGKLEFADCKDVKQVCGHTLQVEHDENWNVVSGKPIVSPSFKMLDTRCAYLLDTIDFTAKPI